MNKWYLAPHCQKCLQHHGLIALINWIPLYLENLFSRLYSHDEYLWQVSLKSLHRYRDVASSSSSSSTTNFIATQLLNKTSGPLCVTCYTSVNATVTGSVRHRMIYVTVPSSVHAWMPPVTTVTWSPAAACSRLLLRQRGRVKRDIDVNIWMAVVRPEHLMPPLLVVGSNGMKE